MSTDIPRALDARPCDALLYLSALKSGPPRMLPCCRTGICIEGHGDAEGQLCEVDIIAIPTMLRLLTAAIATLSLLPSLYATPAVLTERASGSTDLLGLKSYHNPIISGFAPDPSCIRLDTQYFCVTSSFSTFPGIPVYTSKDLAQWQQIGKYCALIISLLI